MSVKNKRDLKKMAQDFAKSLLKGSDLLAFSDVLNQDENEYVVSEIHKIAERITDREELFATKEIVNRYFKEQK